MLTKCSNKFDCLINEILFIRELKPALLKRANELDSRRGIHLKSFFDPFFIMLIRRDYRNLPNATPTHFALRVQLGCRNSFYNQSWISRLKEVWKPILREGLNLSHERKNLHYRYAIAAYISAFLDGLLTQSSVT